MSGVWGSFGFEVQGICLQLRISEDAGCRLELLPPPASA